MPGGTIQLSAPFFTSDALVFDNDTNMSMFKAVYKRHRNFAKQKFRLEYDASVDMHIQESTRISFKVVKYADLLYDAALCIQLPDIWSPIQSPIAENGYKWTPYEFKWIENIGCHIIKDIEFNCGGQILQKFSGEFLAAVSSRDMSADKKEIFDQMTGNVKELHNPAFAHGRMGEYPSAYYTSQPFGAEPSIRGRQITIPLHLWFTEHKAWMFPLCALRDMDIWINVTLRPLKELFRVRDITDAANYYPYIQPDFGSELFQIYRFLQSPPAPDLSLDAYLNRRLYWDADIHIICTQLFLDEKERQQFIHSEHSFLVPMVTEYDHFNQIGTSVFPLPTSGLVTSWMMRFRRSDAYMRNEWNNYTNWPYPYLPDNIKPAPLQDAARQQVAQLLGPGRGPGKNPDNSDTHLFISGPLNMDNYPHIMETMSIKINGEYRENQMTRDVFRYLERYNQTAGSGGLQNGLYCYHFGMNTGLFQVQPSGCINTSKYSKIELVFTLFTPPTDASRAPVTNICNSAGEIVGVRKETWRLFQYTFDIRVFEERYNLFVIKNGSCRFIYA